MSAPPLVLMDLDCNDGSTYFLQPGVSVGANQKTWDEVKSYTGAVDQVNITEAATIDMVFPLIVKSDTAASLRAALRAINDRIDSIVPGSSTAVYDGESYVLAVTPRISWVEDAAFTLKYWTKVTLALKRLPD